MNPHTLRLRRRFRRSFISSIITLVIATGGLRLVQLGYRGDFLLPLILLACVSALLFLHVAGRMFACQGELKRLALIDSHRVYGGGQEFVSPAAAREKFTQDNIWRP